MHIRTLWKYTYIHTRIQFSLCPAYKPARGPAYFPGHFFKGSSILPYCFTFFYERNYELPGARKGLQIKETKRGEKEEEETGSWPKAREIGRASCRERVSSPV